MVLDRVRESGQVLRFSLRCDTPEFKRLAFVQFRRLEGDGSAAGRVEVVNGTLAENRYAVPVSLLDAEVPRGKDFLIICS